MASWRWLSWSAVAVLALVALWSSGLFLFNWWAAGGPPTPDPAFYLRRAYIFLSLAASSLVLSVVLTWLNLRRARR